MIQRWFVRRFLTRVDPTLVGFTTHDAAGEPTVVYLPAWEVSRPDWWRGGRSGVKDVEMEVARRRLDEWQDDMWRRSR